VATRPAPFRSSEAFNQRARPISRSKLFSRIVTQARTHNLIARYPGVRVATRRTKQLTRRASKADRNVDIRHPIKGLKTPDTRRGRGSGNLDHTTGTAT
jgi:hypothetical protein